MTRLARRRWSGIGLAVLALWLPSASASAGPGSGFGNGGTLYTSAEAILPLPGGDIVLATADSFAIHVWRVTSDGAYRNGSTRVPCPRDRCLTGLSLARDSRGRIVIAAGPRVVRLLPSGAVDVAFGDRGTAALPAGAAIGGLAPTAADAILVAGSGRLTKLAPDGALDASFGDGGSVGLPDSVSAAKVVVQADGKIVVAVGKVVMRFTSTGAVDSTYGDAGRAATERLNASALALQPDGKLLAAGLILDEAPYRAAVLRVGGDGRLDPTFGAGGVSARWPPSAGFGDLIGAVGVQPGGGIVVGGEGVYYKQTAWFVHRLRPDGTSAGKPRAVTGIVDPDRDCWGDGMTALAVQPDGKVVTSGWTCDDYRVVRFLADLSAKDAGGALPFRHVASSRRLQRFGERWVATLRVAVGYPATLTASVRTPKQPRLPLLAGSAVGRTVLKRIARSVSVERSSPGPVVIRVLLSPAAIRAGRPYVLRVDAEDRRGRSSVIQVRLVAR